MKFKSLAIIGSIGSLLTACGVENNVSFSLAQGNCADGTTGAPYCMQVTIQNNSGGQNYINSTNFPISNLQLTVSALANNVNYPVTSGSALDPNGCLNSTISPGSSCAFFLQLTGESVPVGQKQAINISANYTINSTLFGTSSENASSSTTVYQRPALIAVNSNGRAMNYSESGVSSVYAAESGSATVNASTNDNYYGFLYLATNNGLYLSGNQTYQYNMIESLTGVSNMVVNGTVGYPVSTTGYIYNSSIKPLSSLYWSNYAATPNNVSNNTAIMALGKLFLSSGSFVYLCNSSSSSPSGCNSEGVSLGSNVLSIGYSPLGFATSPSVSLTGLVVGTQNGLFVESGVLGSQTNGWLPVYLLAQTSQAVNASITKIISDNQQNLYIADINNVIYKMSPSGGNYASTMATINSSYGQVKAMVYDNAGQVLYVGTDGGYVFGCILQNNGSFDCGTPVANNIFANTLFGFNIVSSLSQS